MAISKFPTNKTSNMPFVSKPIKASCHSNLKRKFGNSHVNDDVITLGLILKIFYDKCYLAVV